MKTETNQPMVTSKNRFEAHHSWAKGVVRKKGKNGNADTIAFHPYTRIGFKFGNQTSN